MATGTDIAKKLAELVDRDMTFMHICGTHEAPLHGPACGASCPNS